MLGLLLNILNANEKYLVPHRDTLTIPIQTQLSERQKKFSVFFFLAIFNSSLNFESFEKKDDPHRFSIFEVTNSANGVR